MLLFFVRPCGSDIVVLCMTLWFRCCCSLCGLVVPIVVVLCVALWFRCCCSLCGLVAAHYEAFFHILSCSFSSCVWWILSSIVITLLGKRELVILPDL